ncbi:hypothetical protein [Vibrio metschnikovii]|uniref:hypothetical protein n=1 Tax=Vibrio metschnikovii TaxID=28172 RepID=UPI00130269FB|nr:hypothetical protein [Vibrio metschnikovii]
MSEFVIGIDPDSKANGVAIYENGKLIELHNLTLIRLYLLLKNLNQFGSVVVSIEDNNAVSAIYAGRYTSKDNEATKAKKAQHVGMCKQAQIEVERACEELGIKVVRQRPSGMWKDADSRQFKLATGWKARSNADNRSAAYMGFLGVKSGNFTSR